MTANARRAPFALTVGLGVAACASSGAPIRSPQPIRAAPTSCVSTIGADTTVYDIREIDEKPVFRRALKLTYPREALQAREQGRVVVTAIVNAGGDIDQSSVTVVRHVSPPLDDEARRIISTATMWPACRNGQAVRMRIAVPFDFQMRGQTIKVWQVFAVGLAAGIVGAMLGDTH